MPLNPIEVNLPVHFLRTLTRPLPFTMMIVMDVLETLRILKEHSAMVQALGERPARCLPQLPQSSLQFALQANRSERHSRFRLAPAEGLHDRVDS